MSKIKAYYALKATVDAMFASSKFDLYVSNDPEFWTSSFSSDSYTLLLVNGEDRDHTKILNQVGIKSADFDDIRTGISTQTPSTIITKAINNIPGLDLSDFAGISTVRDVLTVIIQHLQPGHCPLEFDKKPKPTGTFTDDFTGPSAQALEDRTGWTLQKDGTYNAVLNTAGNSLKFNPDGGGSGFSYWTCTDQGDADHYVLAQDDYFSGTNDIYLAARLVDEDNFIAYHLGGTGTVGARLCKKVAGILTDSIIATQGGDNYVFKIECSGTDISLYRDTGGGFDQVGSTVTIDEVGINTETSSGLVAGEDTGGATKWDNFENGLLGGGLLPINITDDITLSDTISKTITKNLSDTISLSDSISKSFGLNKSDSVSLSDSMIKTIGLNKLDSIALSDSLSKQINKNVIDSVTISDSISKSVNKQLSDTINLSDNLTTLISLILNLSDTITLSDSISKTAILNKEDTITLSDEISKTFNLTMADVITLADHFSTDSDIIIALLNFIAKNKTFNFIAKNKTFNFNAKPRG